METTGIAKGQVTSKDERLPLRSNKLNWKKRTGYLFNAFQLRLQPKVSEKSSRQGFWAVPDNGDATYPRYVVAEPGYPTIQFKIQIQVWQNDAKSMIKNEINAMSRLLLAVAGCCKMDQIYR